MGADDFWQETLRKRSSKRSVYSASKRFVISRSNAVEKNVRLWCCYDFGYHG